MHRIVKAGILIGVCAVLTLAIPGIRQRSSLLLRKMVGSSSEPWSKVAIQMVPHRWQDRARKWMGHWAVEWTRPLNFPLELGSNTDIFYRIFLGATPNLTSLDCHYSVLAEGQIPHPVRVHNDEEIIIPLVGKVDIMRAAAVDSTETQDERVGLGQLVYYASRLPHTIRAVGPGPSGYLVLRWSTPAGDRSPDDTLPSRSFDFGGLLAAQPVATEGRSRTLIFEGPTRFLRRLHVHASFARLGEGSAPHQDSHDALVVLLQGAVETTTGRMEAPSIVFHPAGRTHFLRSVGTQPARYLAIEFLERD